MNNLFWVILGMIIMALLLNWESLCRPFRERKAAKRYNHLAKGVPSRVVGLSCFSDVWFARKSPLYINGNIYTMDYKWMHCNDESVVLYNEFGEKFTLCEKHHLVSRPFAKRLNREYKYSLYLITHYENTNLFEGEFVSVDSIIEVY